MQFLGNLHLHLWDCGGQDGFYVNYLNSMRDRIFSSVELLVYVFDISVDMDMGRFSDVAEALDSHSPDAKVFVLLHKMDLLAEEDREAVFRDREDHIMHACSKFKGLTVRCFPSSIWDETLCVARGRCAAAFVIGYPRARSVWSAPCCEPPYGFGRELLRLIAALSLPPSPPLLYPFYFQVPGVEPYRLLPRAQHQGAREQPGRAVPRVRRRRDRALRVDHLPCHC